MAPPPKKKNAQERAAETSARVAVNQTLLGKTKDERLAHIRDLIGAADKDYGKGALGTLSGEYAISGGPVEIISTGSLSLDSALGSGGVPRGRVIEIYGPEASGKTTLTLHIIAEAQRAGGLCAFVDAEHALDPAYAAAIGVNIDELLLSQPDSGEQALQMVEKLVASGSVDLVVVDSVSALVPLSEQEGQIGDSQPGAQARLMSQGLRVLTPKIASSKCSVVFINQLRMKIGVMFGSPETTSGGNALKYYASVRLDIRRISSLSRGEDRIGNRCKIEVVKNKLAPPFKKCEVDIIFGEGISVYGELLDLGVAKEVVRRDGAWYSYGEQRLGQGRDNAMKTLRNTPNIADAIRTDLRKVLEAK